MFFLVDNNVKVIFGWSPKCGCSHIKKIYWFLQNDKINNPIHVNNERHKLPDDIHNYTTILVIRNPYDRVVSGFLDKYKEDGQYRKGWKKSTITFEDFVKELVNENWYVIDEHHFTQQLKQNFNRKQLLQSKSLIIYDLAKIDYNFIEQLYNKKIPQSLLEFRGGHERKAIEILNEYVYDKDMSEYIKYKVPTKYFYNNDIKILIEYFYKEDFDFFKEYGFDYKL